MHGEQVGKIITKAYAKITFGIMSNKKQAQYSAYLDAVAHEYTHSITNLKSIWVRRI